jgi:hypothetical protein
MGRSKVEGSPAAQYVEWLGESNPAEKLMSKADSGSEEDQYAETA